jgi:hypothetical protein
MKVLVPSNIPYKEIFTDWEDKRVDKRVNLQNTVFIILDYMVNTNDIYSLWFDPVGLNSIMFKKICGQNFFDVKPELIKRGILIQNTNEGKYEVGVAPEKYNLKFGFCFKGLVELHLQPSTAAVNYQSFKENGYLHKINLNDGKDVEHIFKQFDNLEIEILPEIHEFTSMYQSLLHIDLKKYWNKKKIRYLILAKIGKIDQDIEDLFMRNFNPKLNNENLRFHSLFTNILKEFRSFIRINGNKLIEFDLKSSNLYVLATILNHKFFNEEKSEYNLLKINRKLHNKQTNLKEAKEKEETTEGREGARRRKSPYLCPTFFEQEDLVEFKQISFEDGFYESLIQIAKDHHSDLLVKYPSLGKRSSVKKMVLSFLTDTEKKHREHMAVVKLMKRIFPSICEFVSANLVYRNLKSPMAYLLQRAESFLVLDIVAKKLIDILPNSKVLTIHDCFLLENDNLNTEEIVFNIKKILSDFTGITPGVSVKYSDPMFDIDNIVEEAVKNIISKSNIKEQINTEEEKRLFSPTIIKHVKRGISSFFSGDERYAALEDFNTFIVKKYDLSNDYRI